MSPEVTPIPAGCHAVTPYLILKGAASAIELYIKILGASLVLRLDGPNGTVAHAELRIGDSVIMLADENADMGVVGPQTLGGSPVSLMVYLQDVDEVHRRALELGFTEIRPLQNQFYGDRSATLRDPFGHVWTIATHVEDVPPDELERRMAAFKPA